MGGSSVDSGVVAVVTNHSNNGFSRQFFYQRIHSESNVTLGEFSSIGLGDHCTIQELYKK